ncbi:MAG TPA: hypothetical protein GXZ78_02285 [Eubacteriaceae bacterium]|mgnify:CR=1 FL=1|jgi:hypothetical protein|nr:hypothetical protein [Eubacteriaceae bacterium]
MDCSFIKLYLELLDRGQLNKELEEGIKSHIDYCKECSQELEEIREINNLFNEIQLPSLPMDFTSRVMGRIREDSTSPEKNIWQEFSKWGVSFVAAGLIMFLLNFVSFDFNIVTLTITEKNPDIINKVFEYAPSNILNRGFEQIEEIIENIGDRR